jgi:GAF domain-containing protein
MSIPSSSSVDRLAVLSEIALTLSGELDRRRLYEGIVQGARRLLAVPIAVAFSWDPGRSELTTEASSGVPPVQLALPPADLPPCIARAFTDRATVSVADFSAQPGSALFGERKMAAAAVTPLLRQGQPLGVVLVAHRADGQGSLAPEDLRLLEILAGHVALALGNAEALAGATRRLARAEELAASYRGILESRERETVLLRALDCATTLLGADRAAIYLTDRKEDLSFVAARRLSRHYVESVSKLYRRSVGGIALLARAPIYVADMSTDPRTRVLHDVASSEGLRSMLLVPLIHRADVLGAVALYHDIVWTYDPEDIAPVRGLADQIALALTNASLHTRTQRQLAELRVVDQAARGVAAGGAPAERLRRAASAIVTGGVAQAAWLFDADLMLAAHAGVSALTDEDAAACARAALGSGKPVVHVASAEPLVGAPIAAAGDVHGALVLPAPRRPRPEGRPATLFLTFGEDPPEDAHEVLATIAAQIATALNAAARVEAATAAVARLHGALAAVRDGIIVFDDKGRVAFHNARALELHGLDGEDPTGWTAAEWARATRTCYAEPDAHLAVVDGRRVELDIVRPKPRTIVRVATPVRGGHVVLYQLAASEDAAVRGSRKR